jgi:hypothetical protein
MEDMSRVFEVTDALEVSREQVSVPLAKQGDGGARRLPDGTFEITVPEDTHAEGWPDRLRAALRDLGVGS